jgi:hypothetical protein
MQFSLAQSSHDVKLMSAHRAIDNLSNSIMSMLWLNPMPTIQTEWSF